MKPRRFDRREMMWLRNAKRYEPQEDDKRTSSGESSGKRYAVQARCVYEPVVIGDQIFDSQWRNVNFNDSAEHGVPSKEERDFPGTYDYAAAQALRWWFVASLASFLRGICMETRLVEYEYRRSHKLTLAAYIDPLDTFGEVPEAFLED
jgi:hypothetical protein